MKRVLRIIIICVIVILVSLFIHYRKPPPTKIITIKSRGLSFQVETRAATVGEVLKEQNYSVILGLDPGIHSLDSRLRGNETIEINKPVNIVLSDAGNEKSYTTEAQTVNDLLYEQGIGLSDTDRVSALISTPSSSPPYQGGERVGVFLADGMIVRIDRIVTLPVTEQKEIAYSVVQQSDLFAYYGQEKTIIVGRMGKKEQNFMITYKNGVEIKRKLISERTLEKPANELRTFGVKIEVIEESVGRASWYAYRGCDCAAHPFYDKSRFVRVTSQATGKSVIVKINDRGPELDKHPDRIIDLDSTAFKQLAPLGAGTIGVRVELLK